MSRNLRAFKGLGRQAVTLLMLAAVLVVPFAAPQNTAAQGGSFSGTITDPDGLAPPPGAIAKLLRADHSTFGQASADPDGSFAFDGVPNGNYVLRAVPPVPSDLTQSEPVPLSVMGAPVNVGQVPLTHPSIVGTVYAPDGSTPAPAWIRVHSAGQWTETSAAPHGEIKLGGLPAGTYALQAWPMEDEPLWASERAEITVTPGTSLTMDLTLRPADVWGRAFDSVGNPVKEAVARVLDGDGRVAGRDLTSTSGFFAIGGLEPDGYRLVLEPPWWQSGLIPPEPEIFSVPPPQNLGAIAFGAPRKVVHGKIETNTQEPVLGALIDARRVDKKGHVQAYSGAGGLYSISLSEGLWTLTVEPVEGTVPPRWLYPFGPQLVHFQHDKTPEDKTVHFQVLQADSHVVGRVEMPGGGVPPFTVTVSVRTDAGVGRSQSIDPADGRFDIALPHGAYKVTVRSSDPEYMGPLTEPIRLPPNTTRDLGTMTLLERNATISGVVTGGGGAVAGIPVIAWRPDAPGWAEARSGPDGGYVLALVEGAWLVKPAPDPDQPWLYGGASVEVDVPDGGAITGVDFELTATNAQIRGILVDEQGHPIPDSRGWVNATNKDDPGVQKGAPVEDGAFAVLVPAGRYRVSLQLSPGSPWLASPKREVAVEAGETVEITFELRTKDAAIAGALWDRYSKTVVTGVHAEVMAYSEGAWQRTSTNPGNGTYLMRVAPGIWALGYRVDPASQYVALRHRGNYPVASGQTVPAPLPVAYRDGLIAGVVLAPDGQPLPGAVVIAEGTGPLLGDLSLRATTGEDGRFALRLPHGLYRVRAAGEPQENWIHPLSRDVFVPESVSVTDLELQFLAPDATIEGMVTLAGVTFEGPPDEESVVKLWAYSRDDGYAHTRTELGGRYALDVISNTTWIVGGAYQEGSSYWLARAEVQVPPGGAPQDLEMEGPYPLPAPVTASFDASEEYYAKLADGTSIYIPAGAMPVSGTVTLHITPIATFPHQRHANVYRYGYAFTAADSTGQSIEERFNQEVLITFGYEEAGLLRMGISEQWLKPAYFSTTTDSWTFPESYVVDTVDNVVAMQIDHFTDFALTARDGYQVFLPLVVR